LYERPLNRAPAPPGRGHPDRAPERTAGGRPRASSGPVGPPAQFPPQIGAIPSANRSAKGYPMTSTTLIAIAAVLCGVAVLYVVVSRTMKKRSDEN